MSFTWITPDSNTRSGYRHTTANHDAFHAEEQWHDGPTVRLYDPAEGEVVELRLNDLCHALWAVQGWLADRSMDENGGNGWPEHHHFTSFVDMAGWAVEPEMFYEHVESCALASVEVQS